MQANTIIRVFAVDGPCYGLQYLDLDTGRVLFGDAADHRWYVYELDREKVVYTDFGPSRAAHFDHVEPTSEPDSLDRDWSENVTALDEWAAQRRAHAARKRFVG